MALLNLDTRSPMRWNVNSPISKSQLGGGVSAGAAKTPGLSSLFTPHSTSFLTKQCLGAQPDGVQKLKTFFEVSYPPVPTQWESPSRRNDKPAVRFQNFFQYPPGYPVERTPLPPSEDPPKLLSS